MSDSRLNSLMKYRFTPKRNELDTEKSNPKDPTSIPDTPQAKRPLPSSPVYHKRLGVLGRRGVIVIDSDEDSPRKNSPQKANLQVHITPQKGPHYGSPQKPGLCNNSSLGNNTYNNQQRQMTYGTPQKNPSMPNFQTSPYNRQQSPLSQSSSPWLSKTYGQQNGHLPGPSRSLSSSPASSWSASGSSQQSSSQSYMSRDAFLTHMSTLRSMFPSESKEKLEEALTVTGDVEKAIDYVISTVNRVTPQKRQHSMISSPVSSPVQAPSYKRIRLMSDSSTDGESSSQGPATSPQVADELPFLDKVAHLHSKFPAYTKEVLANILRQYGSRLDKALAALTNYNTQKQNQVATSPTSPPATHNMGSIKAFSIARKITKAMNHTAAAAVNVSDDDQSSQDSDILEVAERRTHGKSSASKAHGFSKFKGFHHDPANVTTRDTSMITPSKFYSKSKATKTKFFGTKRQRGDGSKDLVSLGDDFNEDEEDISDMEDESDEEMGGSTGEPIVDFFNTAQLDELGTLNGCSKKKAESLMALRPFKDWDDLAEKLHEAKLINLITSCKYLLRDRKAVDQLMATCEGFSKRLDEIVKYLTKNNELNLEMDHTHITKQPECLNKEFKLKPFQMVGLNWLMLMHTQELNGILADEMGLGKTIQTIAFLSQLLADGDTGPHVIVCPSSTVDNWLRELARWSPDLSVICYYGSQEERKEMRNEILAHEGNQEFNVMVTTYNIATGSIEDRSLFKKTKFHYSVFDEGHMLKNMGSLRYRNLLKIRASRRLLLTGTPLQNNLIELMSLLQFIMPDLFWDKQEQLKIFLSVSNKSDDARSKYEQRMITRAKGIMKPFYLRRLKHQVLKQLPKKQMHIEHVPLAFEQRELYDELKKKFSEEVKEKADLPKRGGQVMLMELRKAANHHLLVRKKYDDKKLKQMARLMLTEPTHVEANKDYIFEDMQVMNDFELHRLCKQYTSISHYQLDDGDITDSGKFRHLDELLPVMKEQGDRVLLFSQFTMMLDIMEVYMNQRGHKFLRLDGQTPVADRQDLIDKFNTNEDIFIFLLSTKAGGLGINLTAANTVILHDIDFNPHNDLQAEDRCHRVGQTRDVNVYKLLSKGTVEAGMNRCAESKLKLEEDVTGMGRGKKKEEVEDSVDVASLLREALQQDG